MKYPFPERRLSERHKEYPAPHEWADDVRILQAARERFERGLNGYICIACMVAGRDIGLPPERALTLCNMIEERLAVGEEVNTYTTWLHGVLGYPEPLDERAVVEGRLAWLDDLIKEFSR